MSTATEKNLIVLCLLTYRFFRVAMITFQTNHNKTTEVWYIATGKCQQRRRELRQVGGGEGGGGTISEGHIVCNYTKKIAPLMNS